MRFGFACLASMLALATPGIAHGDDDVRVAAVSAHLAVDTFGSAVADAAIYGYVLRDFRVGVGAQVALPYWSHSCDCATVTPLAMAELRLRDTPDLELWLQSALGAVLNPSLPAPLGAAAFAGLAIALPITHAFWFEIVARGGVDYYTHAVGFGQLAIGVTWGAIHGPHHGY